MPPRKFTSTNVILIDQLDDKPHPKISPREKEVLILLCDGLSTKEIGNELGLSPKTVEFHRYNLGKKIGVNEIALMVRWAIRHKIITP